MINLRNRYISAIGISFVIFFLVATLYAIESYLYYAVQGNPVEFWKKFIYNLSGWLPWAFFVPIIIWMGRRFSFRKEGWYTTCLLHIFASIFFVIFGAFVSYAFSIIINLEPQWSFSRFLVYIFGSMILMILTYWVIIGICYLFDYYKQIRAHELKTVQMETQLARAQLEVLKSQLQPHFLFNTLHTITGLMFKNVNLANKMITQLSDLLRFSLEMTDLQEIRLQKEIEFIEIYLNIQKTRFKDRLKVEMDIEPETLDATVPSMILQPIVENAIKHGISPHKKNGKLKIVSRNDNGSLILEVHDNGKGIDLKKENNLNNGVGISNTVERLKQLYPEMYSFEMDRSSEGGIAVQIKIPFKLFEDSYLSDDFIA